MPIVFGAEHGALCFRYVFTYNRPVRPLHVCNLCFPITNAKKVAVLIYGMGKDGRGTIVVPLTKGKMILGCASKTTFR